MKMRKTIRTSRGLLDLTRPAVMGIINATPDSFLQRQPHFPTRKRRRDAEKCCGPERQSSTWEAAPHVPERRCPSAAEELGRLAPVLSRIREQYPDAILSVDTFRASVAHECVVRWNADIINDLSGSETLTRTCGMRWQSSGVPYVLMHTRARPTPCRASQSMTMSPPKCSGHGGERSMRSMPRVWPT